MINFKGQKILVLAPHPDDEVFGCGGLIARAKREGAKVYVLYFTVGTTKDFSKKGLSTQKERIKEVDQVAKYLELDGYKIAFPGNDYHLTLDNLPQKVLINEIERGDKISLEVIKPSTLLIPDPQDYNQDHRAVALAAIAATRPSPSRYKSFQPLVLTYEYSPSSWSQSSGEHSRNFFVSLTADDLAAKLKALALYKSQLKPHPHPLSVKTTRTLIELRGVQAGVSFAEAFCAKRVLV